ncbi:MAG: thiamine phosphate synthase [Candidatus Aminicenantes bacterium]|nr:thiamine phosphate synthase [Candidatus Aminicenantes bacterium]
MDWTLYFVADVSAAGSRDIVALVEAAVEGGVTAVQLRAKDLETRDLLDLARRLVERLAKRRVPLLVNDRVDVALASGAAGVHLGQDDLPPADARRLLGRGRIIGLSANTLREAQAAEAAGADYIGLGPVYATATKITALPILGAEGLGGIRAKVKLPIIGIGGVNETNARPLVEAGASGVAVVSAIMDAPDPAAAARRLRQALGR